MKYINQPGDRLSKPGLTSLLFAIIVLAGCSLSSHPSKPASLGKATGTAAMEAQLDLPGPVELETINSADWSVSLAGLVNLKNPAAVAAGLKDRDEAIQVYAHLIKHPKYGNFLIDTGVSAKILKEPDEVGLNRLLRKAIHLERMQIKTSTADILKNLSQPLSGVFFTHLHLDHMSGMPDIADHVPLYMGKTESSERNFANLFVHGASNALLQGKQDLQEWAFQADPQNLFEGIVDIFSDGSVFAISVPGHTAGSTAYLVRSKTGPVLLTGDTCHTRWGWENTVEPGDFTRDNERNLANLKRLKQLVARHPSIQVRFGHQL